MQRVIVFAQGPLAILLLSVEATVSLSDGGCHVRIGSRELDLSELGTPAWRHVSHEPSSMGWAYTVSTCSPIPLQSVGSLCSRTVPSAVLQETQTACHSLGVFSTRSVASLPAGVAVSFHGGDGGRSSVIEIECADVPRPLVERVTEGPRGYVVRVRARAGCALGCARDPVTGAVCGGAQKGACVMNERNSSCVCASEHSGPFCSASTSDSEALLAYAQPALVWSPFGCLSAFITITALVLVTPAIRKQCQVADFGPRGILTSLRIALSVVLLLAVYVPSYLPSTAFSLFKVKQPAPLFQRWRANNYIRDDGLLPFQLCGADQVFPGPRRSKASFSHGGQTFDAILTAMSVWGESAESGEPLQTDIAEFQIFFAASGEQCQPEDQPLHKHCHIPRVHPPSIACLFGNLSTWFRGSISLGRSIAIVQCPLNLSSALPDHIDINLAIGDTAESVLHSGRVRFGGSGGNGIISASICYEHVEAVDDLAICTQPHFFDENSAFWRGDPPYPRESTLLEAFLLHNLFVVNVSRIVMHDLSSNMLPRMKPFFASGKVRYRANWSLEDELPGISGSSVYAFEIHAEATCQWEHRIRSRWVQILHAVDNFLLPLCFGCNASSILSHVNRTAVSEIRVPILEAFSPASVQIVTNRNNVLQRYSLLGEDWIGRGRHTPIGNPRHFNEAWVHDFIHRRNTARGTLSEEASIELGLHTVHILALARPQLDTHIGLPDKWYSEASMRLSALLDQRGNPNYM